MPFMAGASAAISTASNAEIPAVGQAMAVRKRLVSAMTKAAVAMLTKTLAMEAGQAGIRVNALAPGVILTNFSRQHFVDADGTVNEERLQQYKQRFGAMSPLGRIGTPEDIAWTILYLVSDAASFVTGQTIRPNGGVSMPW